MVQEMKYTASSIVEFWLDEIGPKRWFKKDPALDSMIKERFAPAYELAAKDSFAHWAHNAQGSLGLLILLDQFSRNLFRHDERAFACDAKALQIAKQAIAAGFDMHYPPNHRLLFYLPFMHCESLEEQKTALQLVRDNIGPGLSLHHSEQHHAVIEKFGRFPHRNQRLQRESSAEEISFLAQDGYQP